MKKTFIFNFDFFQALNILIPTSLQPNDVNLYISNLADLTNSKSEISNLYDKVYGKNSFPFNF